MDIEAVEIPAHDDLIDLTVEVVAAYVEHNALSAADLPRLIVDVHLALKGLQSRDEAAPQVDLAPAVPIRKSVTPDYIVCLEDGKKFKSLKRHLRTAFNLSPEQYREKWDLARDYPMVAPNYSLTRSSLAKINGLGQRPAAPTAKGKRQAARA